MTEIEQKFSDITRIFAADGYEFLTLRFAMQRFADDAKAGDEAAKQLVEIFDKFHRLATHIIKK